jgi:hypothetical protein
MCMDIANVGPTQLLCTYTVFMRQNKWMGREYGKSMKNVQSYVYVCVLG